MVVFIFNHSNGRAVGLKGRTQEGACCLDAGARDSTQQARCTPLGRAPSPESTCVGGSGRISLLRRSSSSSSAEAETFVILGTGSGTDERGGLFELAAPGWSVSIASAPSCEGSTTGPSSPPEKVEASLVGL